MAARLSDDSSTGLRLGAVGSSRSRGLRDPLQAGPEAVELSFDGRTVVASRRIAPKCLAHERERGGRPSKLVLSAGQALRLRHSASVSL